MTIWDEEKEPDVIRFEVYHHTARDWRRCLLIVRGALWDMSTWLINHGEPDRGQKLMEAYSGLALLTERISDGIDRAEEEEVHR